MRSKIVAEKNNFAVTDIRFPPGGVALNEAAKGFLTKFCLDLQQRADSRGVKLYVLGLAGDGATEKEQWMASAKRAQAVADFLQDTLSSGSRWSIYSWGAGPGGDWVVQDSPISRQSQILIAVLRPND
jgi:outer membrane protein OmpA-like peptidoglycan-associated protein